MVGINTDHRRDCYLFTCRGKFSTDYKNDFVIAKKMSIFVD